MHDERRVHGMRLPAPPSAPSAARCCRRACPSARQVLPPCLPPLPARCCRRACPLCTPGAGAAPAPLHARCCRLACALGCRALPPFSQLRESSRGPKIRGCCVATPSALSLMPTPSLLALLSCCYLFYPPASAARTPALPPLSTPWLHLLVLCNCQAYRLTPGSAFCCSSGTLGGGCRQGACQTGSSWRPRGRTSERSGRSGVATTPAAPVYGRQLANTLPWM